MPDNGWPDEWEPDPRWEVQPEPYEEPGPDHRTRVLVVAFGLAVIVLLVLGQAARSGEPTDLRPSMPAVVADGETDSNAPRPPGTTPLRQADRGAS